MPQQKLSKPPKSVVLEALVDFMDTELNTNFKKRPSGTPTSVRTPRQLIEIDLEQVPTQIKRGGTPSSKRKYHDEEEIQTIDVSPAMIVFTKLLVVAFVVFVYFGFFKFGTTVASMKGMFSWLLKTLKIGVPGAMHIMGNFLRIAFVSLKTIMIDFKGLKVAGFVSVVGLFYGIEWHKFAHGISSAAREAKNKILEAFYKLMGVFNDEAIEPIARMIVRPAAQLVYDISMPVVTLTKVVTFGLRKLVSVATGATSGGGNNLMVAGNHPVTRAMKNSDNIFSQPTT